MFGDHKRILQLAADIEQIKRELRDLTVDFPELQRKMVKVLRNTARERARIEELDTQGEERAQERPEVIPGNGPHTLLSPRQKAIQQQILQRRAGG
jgi:chromosome segregation ATPase